MRNRKGMLILLLIAALALSGCGEQRGAVSHTAVPEAAPEQDGPALAKAQSELGDHVRALMEPYEHAVAQAAEKSGSLSYSIPGDVLNQMALDAEAAGATVREGRWRFTWHEAGDYSYEATAWEAMDQYVPDDGAAPDPADETPLDTQLTGDYAVTGGGFFDRERTYDVSEDLSGGTAVFTDTLNGQTTGYETFRFCVRGGELIFADAALDAAIQEDGASNQDSYLAAVGTLRNGGMELAEYMISDPDQLPDPGTLDWSRFLLSISPISHISLQVEKPPK